MRQQIEKSADEIAAKADRMSLGVDTEHGWTLDEIESGMFLAIIATQTGESLFSQAFRLWARGQYERALDVAEEGMRQDETALMLCYPVVATLRD